MWRYAAVLGDAALVVGTARAKPIPVETRGEAVENLEAAIADEKRAIELLKKGPPHLRARDRVRKAADLERVQLRFFDVRKRQIGRFVVPPLVVPQAP